MSDEEYCSWCVPTWLVILPKVVGGVSVLCSAYLIKTVAVEKNRNAYHRVMVLMSVLDILYSTLIHVWGSWAMPVGTAPLSAGNLATCDAQGFFAVTLAMAGPLCNGSLSTYYNLVITKGWSDSRINKVEKWLYVVPVALGVLTGIIPLATKLIVPGTWACWFANTQYPLGCDSSSTCARGWNSAYYFWPILLLLCVAPAYVAYSMYLVYKHVRNLEKRLEKYQSTKGLSTKDLRDQERKNTAKSRKVMEQSLLYSAAMFLVLVFAFVAMMLPQFGLAVPLWIPTLFAIFNPAQGIFNLGIHLRRTRKTPNISGMKSSIKGWTKPKIRQLSTQLSMSATSGNAVSAKDLEVEETKEEAKEMEDDFFHEHD